MSALDDTVACALAEDHPRLLTCTCGYKSYTARQIIAEELRAWRNDLSGITGARWIADAVDSRANALDPCRSPDGCGGGGYPSCGDLKGVI